MTGDRFDLCPTCGHYRSEHADTGCRCDVLVTRVLAPSYWMRCACAVPAAEIPA
jgi:hypothetical protein